LHNILFVGDNVGMSWQLL